MNYLFKSERLGFRLLSEDDLPEFTEMNKSKDVMKYFPKPLTPEESRVFLDRIRNHFLTYAFSLYAVDLLESETFIGFTGFIYQDFEAYFTPCIEIGWRIKSEFWNKGYGTEAAKQVLNYGYETFQFNEIYSITAKINKKSERIMQKIGMTKNGEFHHPKLEKNSLLKEHVVYKVERNII